jgi:cell division septum initiation protein DivIVA
LENRKKVIKQAVDKKDDIEAIKQENLQLKAEIKQLRQTLAEYQIAEVWK